MVIALLCICKKAYPQAQLDSTVGRTKKEIIGTWLSRPNGLDKWVFSKQGNILHIYTRKDHSSTFSCEGTYTYKLIRTGTACGIDVSEVLKEGGAAKSILELTNVKTNNKQCYISLGVDKKYLTLNYYGTTAFLSFNRKSN